MMTEYRTADGDREVSVHIVYSRRRSMGLEVRPEGEVLARMPQHMPDTEVKGFIEKHRRWIFEKLAAGQEKDGRRREPRRYLP